MNDLKKASCILWNGVLIGFGLLIYSVIVTVGFPDFAYTVHSSIYEMSRSSWNQIMFTCLAIMKILWIMFFVIPYASIWLYLRKHNK